MQHPQQLYYGPSPTMMMTPPYGYPPLMVPGPVPVMVPGPKGPMVVYMVPAPPPPPYYDLSRLQRPQVSREPDELGPDYVSDEDPDADDENEEADENENEEPNTGRDVPKLTSTPVPIRIIDDKPTGPEATVAVVNQVETLMRKTGDSLPAPIGSERPGWGKESSDATPVKNVRTSEVIEVHPKTQTQRIEESDGNNLPEEPPTVKATTDLDRCQKCQKRAPHRKGMRYCSDCFHALPFCRNYDECGLRTDNKEHGYCNTCYYHYSQVSVECRTHYYIDDSGLCKECSKQAEPIKRGQCRNWWLTNDETGRQQRQVCRAVCSRQRRFCRECWTSFQNQP